MEVTDQEFRIIAECQMKLQLEELSEFPLDYYSDFYNEIALKMEIPLVDIITAIIKFAALQPLGRGADDD